MNKRKFLKVAAALAACLCAGAFAFSGCKKKPGGATDTDGKPVYPEGAPAVTKTFGDLEAGYCTWTAAKGADWYNVYIKPVGGNYTKLDGELVREYLGKDGKTYFRADAVGLKAGDYSFKIVPTATGGEEDENFAAASPVISVKSHVREGFGFVNGTSGGAYNEDGTLKSNATVVYITQSTKNTASVTYKGQKYEGLQNILNAYKAMKKEATPLCLRLIGDITDPQKLEKGDVLIDTALGGITFEGIGGDTYADGWGLRIKNSSNVEVRNLGFINCDSDEGDDVGLQQGNDHVWVHNCDFFYGKEGSDADQKKGDGALDTKTSTYVTHSYNRFHDTGKSNLQGMKEESAENRITYHHNWYDHSDSRHPRVRTCTVHIYNNYFDGNAKYGVGATMGASVFVENNVFRSSHKMKPMLSSGQGTDAKGEGTFSGEAGGIIKSYGNKFTGSYDLITQKTEGAGNSIDCYEAASRDERVPNSVRTVSGGTAYSNFDVSTVAGEFYAYNADSADGALENVKTYAGRINHGDFVWNFTDADDASYDVNAALRNALDNYKSELVKINNGKVEEVAGGDTGGSGSETGGESASGQVPAGTKVILLDDGFNMSGVAVVGNYDGKATYEYTDGVKRKCLKMESSTRITLTLVSGSKIKIYIVDEAKKIKINDTDYTTSGGAYEYDLGGTASPENPVTVVITKGDPTKLKYIEII